jgi:hypothetical protein
MREECSKFCVEGLFLRTASTASNFIVHMKYGCQPLDAIDNWLQLGRETLPAHAWIKGPRTRRTLSVYRDFDLKFNQNGINPNCSLRAVEA